MNKAVFLDRDGTIAIDVHYCSRPEDLHLFPGVPLAIKQLNDHGFKVILITNQSGIARGYFTEAMLSKIHNKLINELADSGAAIDSIYYCPHHPDEKCECRKPEVALFRTAADQLQIDLAKSYMIGDQPMDILAGQAVGCKAVLVNTETANWNECGCHPDFIAENFPQAVSWIIEQ